MTASIAPPGPDPLQARSVAVLSVRIGVGLVLLVAAWIGSSDEVALGRQTPWIALGVAGFGVMAGSSAAWLLALRRAVAVRRASLVAALELLVGEPGTAHVGAAEVRVRRAGGEGRLFHLAGCALVADRATESGDAAAWRQAGLEPCEACGA
jgi:hypothetical protein